MDILLEQILLTQLHPLIAIPLLAGMFFGAGVAIRDILTTKP